MKLGTYELLKEQGGIGAGTVWLVRADGAGDTAKPQALARVHKHLLKKPEVAEAFLADVTPAVGFSHANVVAVLDAKSEGGELFAASEHVEGEVLSALLNSAGPVGLSQPVVLRIALDVLEGLAAAHEREPALAHGELGPHQVLVGSDGVARIIGLTTTRALSKISAPIGPKNQERLAYAAPERVKAMSTPGGAASLPAPDARADLFSVAVMLWELLAKQRLFASKIDAAIVQKVLTGPIAALESLPAASVPAALSSAVQQALEREPTKRTRSAAILIAAIEGLGADKIASADAVAAEVERLAGKAIASRRVDLTKPVSKPLASTPKPPEVAKPSTPKPAEIAKATTPKPAEVAKPAEPAKPAAPEIAKPAEPAKPAAKAPLPRKATLLGIPAPVVAKPEPKPASTPQPAAVAPKPERPPIRVDEGLEDDDAAWAEPEPADLMKAPEPPKAPPPKPDPAKAPPPPAKRTLLMGSPSPALKQAIAAADKPDPTKASAKLEGAKPAAEAPKPVVEVAKPAAPAPDPAGGTSGGKTAHTPQPVESPSGLGRIAVGTEKVAPGMTLGRYEVLMPVARGGMASVWAARLPGSRGFQKIFAIKTMLPDVSDDPDFENMFLDEGRVAARIRHPNVVEIIDLGEQSEVLYLVMEWVDGENLGSLVKAARPLGGIPLPIVLKIASQIAAGLHAAHELRDDDGNLVDLVHRDVSPANVLVSSSGYVKIVDFGIAKSKGRLHQTRVGGVVKGKTPYLSPEQLGQLPIDRRSDIFSFGVLLYVLTTGLHPFRGETDAKTIENIALREPVPLHNIVPGTPPEFEAVVKKALQKDPKDRYTTAAEMQRALDQAAAAVGAATNEEDVAAFVKQALGEQLGKRSHDLRAAIDRAEGRAPVSEGDPASAKPSSAKTGSGEPASAKPSSAKQASSGEPASAKPASGKQGEAAPDSVIKPQAVITLHDITLGDDEPEAKPVEAKPVRTSQADTQPALEEVISFDEEPAGDAPPPPRREPDVADLGMTAHPALPPPPPEPEPPPGPAPRFDAPPVSPATDAAIEIPGVPKRRKPVALIAAGVILGLGVIGGGIAVMAGGGGDPPVRTGTTAAPPTATPKPSSAPSATAAPSPAPPTPPETAKPADTGAAAPTETAAPPPPTPPEPAAKAPAPSRPGAKASVPASKPRVPPKKSNNKTYNPPGI
ncbi:serine/threonine protein kinase [Minicystis rosea]|nr:serine/threonine protein kinase [Minicystis rosea]